MADYKLVGWNFTPFFMELIIQPRPGLVRGLFFFAAHSKSKNHRPWGMCEFLKNPLHEINEETGRLLVGEHVEILNRRSDPKDLGEVLLSCKDFLFSPLPNAWNCFAKTKNAPSNLLESLNNFSAEGREFSGVESSNFLLFFCCASLFCCFSALGSFSKKGPTVTEFAWIFGSQRVLALQP